MEKAKPLLRTEAPNGNLSEQSAFHIPSQAAALDLTGMVPAAVPGKLLQPRKGAIFTGKEHPATETFSPPAPQSEPQEIAVSGEPGGKTGNLFAYVPQDQRRADAYAPGGLLDHLRQKNPWEQSPDQPSATYAIPIERPDGTTHTYSMTVAHGPRMEQVSLSDPMTSAKITVLGCKKDNTLRFTANTRTGDTATGYALKDTDIFAKETIRMLVRSMPMQPTEAIGEWSILFKGPAKNTEMFFTSMGIPPPKTWEDAVDLFYELTPEQRRIAASKTWTGELYGELGYPNVLDVAIEKGYIKSRFGK